MIELEIPGHLKELLEADLFSLEDSVDPSLLNKYLYYIPEISRLYGLMVAQLKANKRELERTLRKREATVLFEITNSIDSHLYKNEQMRTAKVLLDEGYQGIMKELNAIESDIDFKMEFIWKFRNLQENLNMIAKLRIAENKY